MKNCLLVMKTVLFVFASVFFTCCPASGLDVSGIIRTNTTWALDNSPYTVTGNIKILENRTLVINPGVSVIFKAGPNQNTGYYILVEGTLNASGSLNNPILFSTEDKTRNWGCIAFTDTSADWNATTSTGCIIKNAIIEYAGNSQGGANIYNSAAIKCFSAAPLIANNIIRYTSGYGIHSLVDPEDLVLTPSVQTISNNMIHNNTTGIFITFDGATIENNYFINNSLAVVFDANLQKIDIKNNTFICSSTGASETAISGSLYYDGTLSVDPKFSVSSNQITCEAGDATLISLTESSQMTEYDYELSFSENNIENSGSGMSVYLNGWQELNPGFINMKNTWWGTVTEATIKALVYDYFNDFNLPIIDYSSLKTEKIDNTGSSLSYPPIANAGSDQTVNGVTNVTLDGSNSYDPDETMKYQWTQLRGPSVIITDSDKVKAGLISPSIGADDTLEFELLVTDANGFYDKDNIIITISGTVINAGADQVVDGGTIVFLDGSNSYDPDDIMAYSWTQTGGPDVVISDADKTIAYFIAPYIGEEIGDLTFQLELSNDTGFSVTDEIIVTINIVNAGTDQVVEGEILVTLDGSNSYDPEEMMSYQWVQLYGTPVTMTNADKAIASFTAPSINEELNLLAFRLTVSNDIGFSDTDEILISVNHDIANAGPDQTIQSASVVFLDGSNSYDPKAVMNYQWSQINGPTVTIINADKVTAGFIAPNEDENNNIFTFRLTVSNNNGFSDADDVVMTMNLDDVADAGPDMEAAGDNTVTLNGSNTYDPLGILTYQWTQTEGPTVIITDADKVKASFIVPVKGDNRTLIFRLVVSSPTGFSDDDEITVTISEPETIIRSEGVCFIGTLSGEQLTGTPQFSLFLFTVFLLTTINLFISLSTRQFRYGMLLLTCLLFLPANSFAGYFSVGGGDGGEAEEPNVTIETGILRAGGGKVQFMMGAGIFGIFHGDDEIPPDTRNYECPHDDYLFFIKLDEGVESGLFVKTGIGLFDTGLYFSILGGVSMVSEIEVVQSNQTSWYYENSSEQKYYGIYGGGIGYFPYLFHTEFCIQIDYDNRRGVTGSLGFHW